MKKITVLVLVITLGSIFYSLNIIDQPIPLTHYCSINDEDQPEEVNHYFEPSRDAQKVIDTLLSFIPIANRSIEFKAAAVEQAIAVLHNNRRFVFFDEIYLEKIINNYARWSVYFVMAHELAHHLNVDALDNTTTRQRTELDADAFAGQILAIMGASLDATIKVIEDFDEESTETHPAQRDRKQSAVRGWKKGREVLRERDKEKWTLPYQIKNCREKQGEINVKNTTGKKIVAMVSYTKQKYMKAYRAYTTIPVYDEPHYINPRSQSIPIRLPEGPCIINIQYIGASPYTRPLLSKSISIEPCMGYPLLIE